MSAIIVDYQMLWCLRRSATRFNKRRLLLKTVLILVGDGALISHQISGFNENVEVSREYIFS